MIRNTAAPSFLGSALFAFLLGVPGTTAAPPPLAPPSTKEAPLKSQMIIDKLASFEEKTRSDLRDKFKAMRVEAAAELKEILGRARKTGWLEAALPLSQAIDSLKTSDPSVERPAFADLSARGQSILDASLSMII